MQVTLHTLISADKWLWIFASWRTGSATSAVGLYTRALWSGRSCHLFEGLLSSWTLLRGHTPTLMLNSLLRTEATCKFFRVPSLQCTTETMPFSYVPLTHCLVHIRGLGFEQVRGQAVPHSLYTMFPKHTLVSSGQWAGQATGRQTFVAQVFKTAYNVYTQQLQKYFQSTCLSIMAHFDSPSVQQVKVHCLIYCVSSTEAG